MDQLVPYDEAVRLHAALTKAGVTNQLLTIPGGKHGNFTPDERTKIFATIREFLGEERPRREQVGETCSWAPRSCASRPQWRRHPWASFEWFDGCQRFERFVGRFQEFAGRDPRILDDAADDAVPQMAPIESHVCPITCTADASTVHESIEPRRLRLLQQRLIGLFRKGLERVRQRFQDVGFRCRLHVDGRRASIWRRAVPSGSRWPPPREESVRRSALGRRRPVPNLSSGIASAIFISVSLWTVQSLRAPS